MNIIKSPGKLVTIIIHILIWAVFCVTEVFFRPLPSNIVLPYQLWVQQGIMIVLLIISFYINSAILVPGFLLKSKTGIYFLLIVIIVAFILLANYYTNQWLHIHELMEEAFRRNGPPRPLRHGGGRHGGGGGGAGGNFHFDTVMVTTTALVLGISTSISVIQKWQHDKQLHLEMQRERVDSELSFLKAQINPHFFFNTLNNIYALTYVDADTSRKAIHQLSRMMRYVLYDTQVSTTLLSQEIAFVNDYISLMKLRLTSAAKITFNAPTNLKDVPMAPMLFLPFVENAFKHGVSGIAEGHISIWIMQNANEIELIVKNTVYESRRASEDESNGIGIANTTRRLELLYPGKYNLTAGMVNETEYEVKLKLIL